MFGPHKLTVEFIVSDYSNVLALVRILTNPSFEFTDDHLIYETYINDFEYEYISGNQYLLKIVYNAYIFENKYISVSVKQNESIVVESPSPTAINIEIKAKETLLNKTITLTYFDYFTNRNYQNDIKIVSLLKDKVALIDSNKFLCFVDKDQLYLNNITINLYPYTKGNIEIKGIDSSVELNMIYRKAY